MAAEVFPAPEQHTSVDSRAQIKGVEKGKEVLHLSGQT